MNDEQPLSSKHYFYATIELILAEASTLRGFLTDAENEAMTKLGNILLEYKINLKRAEREHAKDTDPL